MRLFETGELAAPQARERRSLLEDGKDRAEKPTYYYHHYTTYTRITRIERFSRELVE